ncbi:hypothetical protein BDN72DRAFT_340722 [Pluteus cervinus]|uniref:Uncharacterized protein n=1 Tax=Pluteus cervinus TaxID=181527 RepID=A0ACD3AC51_9AGAR|nr:hypothetical protein BDN72DRAFT_340722 [Pluteus cervinus]
MKPSSSFCSTHPFLATTKPWEQGHSPGRDVFCFDVSGFVPRHLLNALFFFCNNSRLQSISRRIARKIVCALRYGPEISNPLMNCNNKCYTVQSPNHYSKTLRAVSCSEFPGPSERADKSRIRTPIQNRHPGLSSFGFERLPPGLLEATFASALLPFFFRKVVANIFFA